MENSKKWTPNKNHLAVLKAIQARNYLLGTVEAIRECGLHESTYYLWIDNPAFVTWWEDQAESFFTLRLPRVKAAVLDAATGKFDKDDGKYNSKAQELFLQRFDKGFVPRSQKKVQHSGGIGVDLDLSQLTDADLRTLARASGIAPKDKLDDDERKTNQPTHEPEAMPGESGDVGDGAPRSG